tara:strand:- start:403 stop:579 length:177 start_codon:yes stop_codon:yes gene_type:complete
VAAGHRFCGGGVDATNSKYINMSYPNRPDWSLIATFWHKNVYITEAETIMIQEDKNHV